ncbi:MAG: hypothetical protein AAB902_00070 [Patescibacteria group bacterium]
MGEIIFKIWFLVAILPFTIASEGWKMFKKFMSHGNRWHYFPYVLLVILVILLVVLLMLGYR